MIPQEGKTKSELVQELSNLRRRVAEFEQASYSFKQKGDLLSERGPSRHSSRLGTQRQSTHANPGVAQLLTRSEMKVLHFILDGKSNKEIANLLHRSVRTVEVHRSHIMRKLEVDNLVDLVKRAAAMGLVDLLVS
ncbi:MAG: response regulator transcription factor [Sedimentisphaerales bacterium]